MSQQQPRPDQQPRITLTKTADYRDSYANSVQVRLSVWDFMLVFGTLGNPAPDEVHVENFQGIYLSPQQAKALLNVLAHNVAQYEQTFGPISLDGSHAEVQRYTVPPNGPIH
ncbi:DUF3467 domain-containing protein [Granulicella sp. 5B5]|uniref:DUF3467 domain-containing protein n=1 Tax=Granulicella sp. 5B5 TaxID=1617967 RepID=UPI0015F70B40|nr:DUF3467 domain-containing protein [Granulicella sp. 5B5]QMV19980.1 DUF3467 domain-containing protein [Granulicella sp. 5B5]